jgi:hypothetical protein
MLSLPTATYQQSAAAKSEVLVHQWTTACSGPVTMSGGGFVRLEKRLGSGWHKIVRGLSINADLEPGTYRVLVENITHLPMRYQVRWRISAG